MAHIAYCYMCLLRSLLLYIKPKPGSHVYTFRGRVPTPQTPPPPPHISPPPPSFRILPRLLLLPSLLLNFLPLPLICYTAYFMYCTYSYICHICMHVINAVCAVFYITWHVTWEYCNLSWRQNVYHVVHYCIT